MFKRFTHRMVYVITEKRVDDSARCVASTIHEAAAFLTVWGSMRAAMATRSGTAYYLHAVPVPRRIPAERAYLWAQDRLVNPVIDESTRVNDHGVVIERDGVHLLVDAR